MTAIHEAINALAQATAWLVLVWLAVWLLRLTRRSVQWRVLALRIGLVGVPVTLAIGLMVHALPWARAVVRVPRPAAVAPQSAEPGNLNNSLAAWAVSHPLDGRPVVVAADPATALDPTHPAATPAAPQTETESELLAATQSLVVRLGLIIWIGGTIVCGGRLAVGLRRLARRRKIWRPVVDVDVLALTDRLAARIGLRRKVQLLACDDLPMPVATGFRRLTVVVPRKQFDYLPTAEGQAMLTHELAHLRFADPLWRMLAAVAGALLWFHPLMLWLNRRMEIESEFQSDQAALGLGADNRGYARLLLSLAERVWKDRPLTAAAIGAVHRTSHLERRLKMILSKTAGGVTAVGRAGRAAILIASVLRVVSLSRVALRGEEGLGLEQSLQDRPADRPHEEPPPPAREANDKQAAITLTSGEKVEGVWLGSTPEGVRLRVGDAERTIPLASVARIKMLHAEPGEHRDTPPAPAPSEHPRVEGEHPRPDGERARTDGAPWRSRGDRGGDRTEHPADAPRPPAPELTEEQRAQVRKLLEDGGELARTGKFDEAADKFEQALKIAPRHHETLRALAHTYTALGQKDKAEQAERRLRELGPPPMAPRDRERVAAAEQKLAAARRLPDGPDRDKAITEAEHQVQEARPAERSRRERGPMPPPSSQPDGERRGRQREMARRADTLFEQGKFAEAAGVLEDMHKQFPRQSMVLRSMVRVYEKLGQADKAADARKALREALDSERRGATRPRGFGGQGRFSFGAIG